VYPNEVAQCYAAVWSASCLADCLGCPCCRVQADDLEQQPLSRWLEGYAPVTHVLDVYRQSAVPKMHLLSQ
jgi:hypothetical protein